MSSKRMAEQSNPELQQRTLADAHLDIGLANDFRIEYIKHLVSVATGVFVFSVAFMKDLVGQPTTAAHLKSALLIGWIALVISIVAGIVHMRLWAQYYLSWGLHYDDDRAKSWRRKLMHRIKSSEYAQFSGFAVGLVSLSVFAGMNLYQ